MALYEQLDIDIKEAMKAREKEKVEVLRFLKAAVKDIMINEQKEITDEVVISVVTKSIKQRKDSIESYRKGGREDLAEKDEAGVAILTNYLPEQLSEEAAKELVKVALNEAGLSKKEDMSSAMKIVMPKLKGKIDGKTINKIVGECLN